MKAQTLATIFSVGLSVGLVAHGQACKLTDQYVKHEALSYVRKQIEKASPDRTDTKLQARITIKESDVWTVVVSPLPVTPDGSFILRVRCTQPTVEELSERVPVANRQ